MKTKKNSVQMAKDWWAMQVNSKPVWNTKALPEAYFKDLLISLGMAHEIRRDTLILGKPNTDATTLITTYFWETVASILKPYEPYMITGVSAMQLHLETQSIPKTVSVLTKSSSNRIKIETISELHLEKSPLFFSDPIKKNQFNDILTVEPPESLLARISPKMLRDYPQVVSSFLKNTSFDHEALLLQVQSNAKPVVHLRIAELLAQVGRKKESDLIKAILKAGSSHTQRGKAQILKHPLPKSLTSEKKLSDPKYVTRFRDEFRFYSERAETLLKGIKVSNWTKKQILNYAKENKKYDTYHSSTIEGYRVTSEEIELLLSGNFSAATDNTPEAIENKVALKGYLSAHDYVLSLIKDQKNENLTETSIREIYAHLFAPTLEVGLHTKQSLTAYRNDSVFIRQSRYVPPNHQKISELMRCLVDELANIENPIAKAFMAHYGFVTIHPYLDGNGRVGRLLMNYLLGIANIPWITIQMEDRAPYFKSLETAQCDENIEPFILFLKNIY